MPALYLDMLSAQQVQKDTKIATFLEICRKDLAKDYSDLRSTNGEGLMFVLEEFIIPSVIID